jgi:hypothetical protein
MMIKKISKKNEKEIDKFSINELKKLKDNVDLLHETEYIEILKLLIINNEKYTENNNGIFINTSKLKKNTLNELYDFVNYCLSNKELLETNSIKMNNFNLLYPNLFSKNIDKNIINENVDVDKIIINNNYNSFKNQLLIDEDIIYNKSLEPFEDLNYKKKNTRLFGFRKKKRDIDLTYNEVIKEEYI